MHTFLVQEYVHSVLVRLESAHASSYSFPAGGSYHGDDAKDKFRSSWTTSSAIEYVSMNIVESTGRPCADLNCDAPFSSYREIQSCSMVK